MPLNPELRSHLARFVETFATAPDYRLYALACTTPPKPGLLRVAPDRGTAIEVEVWAMPAEPFGRFVAAAPPPLSIGSIKLADGRMVKGFLVEAEAVNGARDISDFGGSGKRTQVCDCRPTLPGMVARWNRVEAIAKSRP